MSLHKGSLGPQVCKVSDSADRESLVQAGNDRSVEQPGSLLLHKHVSQVSGQGQGETHPWHPRLHTDSHSHKSVWSGPKASCCDLALTRVVWVGDFMRSGTFTGQALDAGLVTQPEGQLGQNCPP